MNTAVYSHDNVSACMSGINLGNPFNTCMKMKLYFAVGKPPPEIFMWDNG